MVWCDTCDADVELEVDESNGFSCCATCGRVLEEGAFASDVQFAKGGDGEGGMVGQIVGEGGQSRGLARFSGGRVWGSSGGEGQEAAINKGRSEIFGLVETLRVTPAMQTADSALRLYRLALQRGFTRGRRVNQVAATCIYIILRLDKKPYMLIDLSDQLSVNVYTLGGVYLQLLRLLRLDDSPVFTRPIDPSLYLHRFTDRLDIPADKKDVVRGTALKIVQSMKRDWMQTGRRPSGICGAALFIAAHIHGCDCTKRDVMAIVHVSWNTVERRVVEFAQSSAGHLTLEEFEGRMRSIEREKEATLLEHEQRLALPAPPLPELPHPRSGEHVPGGGEVAAADRGGDNGDGEEGGAVDAEEAARLERMKAQERTGACEHVEYDSSLAFAHGMCRTCFEEYLNVSGGPSKGEDPPAFVEGVYRDLRAQVLALTAPPARQGESGLLRLAEAGEQLREEEAQGPAPRQAAGGEGEDGDGLGQDLRDMERELAREELGRLTAVLGSSRPGKGEAGGPSARPGGSEDPGSPQRATKEAAPTAAAAVAVDAPGLSAAGKRARQGDANGDGDHGSDSDQDGQGEPDGKRARGDDGGAGDGGHKDGEGAERAIVELVPEPVDTLSDVDDEDVEVYIASAEEAEVKAMLWTELNKDWLAKQAAKAAAGVAAKEGPSRAKRSYVRKAKPPPAETPEDGVKTMLESKKLSNKINYKALQDLFSDPLTDRSHAASQQQPEPSDASGGRAATGTAAVGARSGAGRQGRSAAAAAEDEADAAGAAVTSGPQRATADRTAGDVEEDGAAGAGQGRAGGSAGTARAGEAAAARTGVQTINFSGGFLGALSYAAKPADKPAGGQRMRPTLGSLKGTGGGGLRRPGGGGS